MGKLKCVDQVVNVQNSTIVMLKLNHVPSFCRFERKAIHDSWDIYQLFCEV